jgi:enoyl-CoA hydratase
MLRAGYALTARVLAYPHPVIVACNGHSLAMGVFLMLSADYVIGSRGDFKIAANEVAIGMTMPRVAAAMLRNRLTPSAYQRAVTVAEYFDVESARDAGFFDELVAPQDLTSRADACANAYKALDPQAHKISKRRLRAALIRRIRLSIPLDLLDAALIGLRRARSS